MVMQESSQNNAVGISIILDRSFHGNFDLDGLAPTIVKFSTAAAKNPTRLPDAVAVLLRGNREVLRGFTDEEVGLRIVLLTRLIANLDQIASLEASPRHAN